MFLKFFRPFLKRTADVDKFPTDSNLDYEIGYASDLLHTLSPLMRKIIYKKILLFFQYRWKFLVGRLFTVSIFGILVYLVLITTTNVKITTDSRIIRDTVILGYKNDSSMNLRNFLNQIAYLESRYFLAANRNNVNFGLYQMNKDAIKSGGYGDIPISVFLNHPEIQDLCVINLMKKNKKDMKKYIKKFNGKIVDGILVTESGIIALSHLGIGNAQKYLDSGIIPDADAYGNPVRSYLKLGGYNLNLDKIKHSLDE